MAQKDQEEVIARAEVVITYVPVRDEIAFQTFLPSLHGKDTYEIRPNASLDPVDEAKRATSLADGRKTVVLVPGRRFDATGTRHGKGAGWYDRFLSAIPASWVRIGFCTDEQFSPAPLIRESWDEPMDYVVVVADGIPTCYTTHARPAML